MLAGKLAIRTEGRLGFAALLRRIHPFACTRTPHSRWASLSTGITALTSVAFDAVGLTSTTVLDQLDQSSSSTRSGRSR